MNKCESDQLRPPGWAHLWPIETLWWLDQPCFWHSVSHCSQGCHLDTGIHWQSSLQPEVLCPLAGLFGTGADVGLDGQTWSLMCCVLQSLASCIRRPAGYNFNQWRTKQSVIRPMKCRPSWILFGRHWRGSPSFRSLMLPSRMSEKGWKDWRGD